MAQGEEKAELIAEVPLILNSSTLGYFLKPRDVVKVDLPPNTKSWFYQFTANLNEKNTNNFKSLSSSVTKSAIAASAYYTAGATIVLVPLLESDIIPTGEAEVSVYCLDEFNQSAFMKNNNFTHLGYGIAENKNAGRIFIPNTNDKSLYIGIKNTSSMQRRVYVNLQIYAITEKSNPVNYDNVTNGWSLENKRRMFNRWSTEAKKLGYNEYDCLELVRCTQTTILSTYSFSDYQNMGNNIWTEKVTQLFKQCLNQVKK
ncbi:MAG: hypothetical protein Q8K64_12425 [Sediminibacterium sp.]|nr:hypothetical protein [Sediminibacterium sp.]